MHKQLRSIYHPELFVAKVLLSFRAISLNLGEHALPSILSSSPWLMAAFFHDFLLKIRGLTVITCGLVLVIFLQAGGT